MLIINNKICIQTQLILVYSTLFLVMQCKDSSKLNFWLKLPNMKELLPEMRSLMKLTWKKSLCKTGVNKSIKETPICLKQTNLMDL